MDVVFVLKMREGSQNNSCDDAGNNVILCRHKGTRGGPLSKWDVMVHLKAVCFPGLPSPCLFVLAVDGTDGHSLWERSLSPDFHWAQCGLKKDTGRNWDCLVSHSDNFTAIDKHTGL